MKPSEQILDAFPGSEIVGIGRLRFRDHSKASDAESLLSVDRAKGCAQPIRLTGSIEVSDAGSGDLVHQWSSERDESNGFTYVPCKTRRADRCPSCSQLYQGDAFRLIIEGLRGGDFAPSSVKTNPALFVTFTAPGFGPVHSSRKDNAGNVLPCRPRRDGEICEHGNNLSCSARHGDDDPALGQAICMKCFDYDRAVLWNHFAGKLWRQSRIAIDRYLAKRLGMSRRSMRKFFAATEYVKVAEFQMRGLVHFHVAIRLDRSRMIGESIGLDDLIEAVRSAHRETDVEGIDGERIGWGSQLNVQVIRTDEWRTDVAGYLAKYSTKGSDASGSLSSRIRDERQIDYLPINDHQARLVRAAWKLTAKTERRRKELLANQPKAQRSGSGSIIWNENAGRWILTLRNGLANNKRRLVRRSFKTKRSAMNFLRRSLVAKAAPRVLGANRWAHQFGFGGHFLTKSRSWSTTFKALRQRRADHNAEVRRASWQALSPQAQLVIEARWEYAGAGYQTATEAHMAALHRSNQRTTTAEEAA